MRTIQKLKLKKTELKLYKNKPQNNIKTKTKINSRTKIALVCTSATLYTAW